jgi:hypothetical protein
MSFAESIPSTVPEPGVGSCYRHGGRAFLAELPILLVLGLVTGAVSVGVSALTDGHGLVALVGFVLLVLVGIPLKWGFYFVCLRAARGEAPEGRDLLRPFERHREAAIAAFVVLLGVVGGLVLLVVPGVIVYCRTRFVPYLLTDEGMSAEQALRESWRLTRGRTGTILGIVVTGWILCAIGLAAAGIGVLPALIWWDLAMASYYHAEVEPGRELEELPGLEGLA